MNENVLTLEQIQNMSTEDLSMAYQNGYRLSESSDIYSSDIYSSDIYLNSLQDSHYTWTDATIITTAILASVGIVTLVGWYMLKREERKIINELKETVVGALVKKGPSIIEVLSPYAQKALEKIYPVGKATLPLP